MECTFETEILNGTLAKIGFSCSSEGEIEAFEVLELNERDVEGKADKLTAYLENDVKENNRILELCEKELCETVQANFECLNSSFG